MLRILTRLIESLGESPGTTEPAGREHTLQLATAVLLIEVVRADGDIDGAELAAVADALHARFTLTQDEIRELIELARHRSEHSHDLYGFTSRLNEALGEAERIHLFELLWEAAFADGRADAHEAHLLRRLADLLHLRHADAVGAKLRAEAAGKPPP